MQGENGVRTRKPANSRSRAAPIRSKRLRGLRLLHEHRAQFSPTGARSTGRATLQGADLTGAECEGSDFTGADLRQSSLPNLSAFKNSKLFQANFEGATVDIGVLCYAQLEGARLAQAQVAAVNSWWNVHKATQKAYDAILLATKADISAPNPVEGLGSPSDDLRRLRLYDLERSQQLEQRLGRDTSSTGSKPEK